MVREKVFVVIVAIALALTPALAMAQDSTVEKGSVSRTGTGAAANLAEARDLAEGDIIFIGATTFVVVAGALVCVAACGGGGGGSGTSTATSTN